MSMPKAATSYFLALVVLCGVDAFAGDSVDSAVKRLSTVERFAFGGVGYAGIISNGEVDFKIVLSQPQAAALKAFERLYAIGNPQGKAYALSGIRNLNPTRFRELQVALRTSAEQVEVMRGCMLSHEALPDVATQIDHGEFRF